MERKIDINFQTYTLYIVKIEDYVPEALVHQV